MGPVEASTLRVNCAPATWSSDTKTSASAPGYMFETGMTGIEHAAARISRGKRTKLQSMSDALLSRGSKNHANGKCRPCVQFNSPDGCVNGDRCNFCHCS